MIEQGLQALIQGGIAPLVAPGFWVQLPENQIHDAAPQAYTIRSLTSEPTYVLDGQDEYTELDIRIDCHGQTMAQAIALARSIDNAIRAVQPNGKPLTLSDPDSTVLYGIFRRAPYADGYSDLNRTFVRTLEYQVLYDQQ